MLKYLSLPAIALAAWAMSTQAPVAQVNECNTQVGNFDVMDNGETIGKVALGTSADGLIMEGQIDGQPVLYRFTACLAEDLAIFERHPEYEGPKEIGLQHDEGGGDDMWLHYKDEDGKDNKLFLGNPNA